MNRNRYIVALNGNPRRPAISCGTALEYGSLRDALEECDRWNFAQGHLLTGDQHWSPLRVTDENRDLIPDLGANAWTRSI